LRRERARDGTDTLTPEATMNRLKMKIDEIKVETFELSREEEDAMVRGAVRTFDPTKCEPHSCVPTFPC